MKPSGPDVLFGGNIFTVFSIMSVVDLFKYIYFISEGSDLANYVFLKLFVLFMSSNLSA